jgi:hypothetical protein
MEAGPESSEEVMSDIVMVGVIVLFFAATLAVVARGARRG